MAAAWVLKRKAARVVVLNTSDQVFLIRALDPANRSTPPWWELPGGGIDPGETSEQAVLRELREEAGIVDATVGPVVWTQHVEFDFGGYHFDQDEVIHLAWTDQHHIGTPGGLEFLEAQAFLGSRWWPAHEVYQSNEPFLPPGLPSLLRPLVDGPPPPEPLDITPAPIDSEDLS